MKNAQEKTTTASFPVTTYQAKDVAWTLTLTAAAVIFPALLAHTPHNQWITGTIVNAILFLAVWRVGIANTLLIAILPSSVALMRGLLPAPMAMLIPYIILSNVILVSAFYVFKKHLLAGVISASFIKFLVLFAITSQLLKVASPLIAMMQWPQLFTALAGGLIAIGFIRLKSFF
ncbi:MAG: ECF transporter S component [Parcubacteria group bacterium]|jgi:hypothetical protein